MWKNFKERLAGWIPEHISTKFIVLIYIVFDFFCIVRKKKRIENYEHNLKALLSEESPLSDGFIENQNNWGNVHFGRTTMAFAGCEIMAVYNTFRALGIKEGPEFLSELISVFEVKGAALQGWMGSSPFAIKKYLDKHGIKSRIVWKEEELSDVNVAIATIYNDRYNLYSQIHTIAFTKETDGYAVHNASRAKKGCQTLREAVSCVSEAPKLICAIEITGYVK